MIDVRPAVAAFAQRMEEKLRQNDERKGGWEDCDADWLLQRLREETKELQEAIKRQEHQPIGAARAVADEAADVANFAMMIADVCGGPR